MLKRTQIFFIFLISISLVSAGAYSSNINTGDSIAITTTTISGNLTNLSQLQDTNIPSPTDEYVLTYDSSSGKWIASSAASVGDTNETTRVNTMTGDDCGAGDYAYGFDSSGNIQCREDTTGSGGTGKAGDGVYLYNDSTTIYFNETLATTNLSVNSSNFWDGLNIFNTTQFENIAGALTLIPSYISTLFDSFFSGKTTDDLTQGSTNLYDNSSWNESLANDLYVNIDGDTWEGDMSAGDYNLTDIQRLVFNTTGCNEDSIEGTVCWNTKDKTLDLVTGLSNVIQIGQEQWALAKNGDSVPLLNGQVVTLVGSSGDRGLVAKADASNMSLAARLSVVTLDSCAVNADCAVTTFGRVRNLNTSQWIAGTMLYLSDDGSGNLTSTVPEFPNFRVLIAFVVRSHEQDGIIFVQPQIDYTDGVTLNEVYIRQNLTVAGEIEGTSANITTFYTPQGSAYNFYNGLNLILNVSSVEGNNFFGIETDGAFLQLYANPNPSNDYLLFTVTETQGADTEVNFYEGGTGHNRFYDSGSARFGGDPSYLCSELTTDVDCNTPSTGADIVVEDDGWFGGKLFASDWTNVTISESQINDLSHNTYTNGTGLSLNGSNFFSILLNYMLPQSCGDGEIAEYNTTSEGWDCAIDNTAASGMANWVLAALGVGGSESITDGETVTLGSGNDYIDVSRTTNNINYTFNEARLNNTIDARDSDTTYSALSEFSDDLGDRGYTSLSNFSDDLGHIEDNSSWNESHADTKYLQSYTETDPTLWNTEFNSTFDSRDQDTTYTNGSGLSLVGTEFSLVGSIFSGAWGDLTGIPSGFEDDTDNDTTYTAGSNMSLTAEEFSVDMTSLESYLDTIYAAIGSVFSGVFTDLDFTGTTGFDDLVDNDTTYSDLSEFNDDLGHIEDNSSWNESHADTKYLQSYTETDPTLWNAEFNATFDSRDSDTTYSDLSEFNDDLGHIEDNSSWNESHADTKYLQSYTETDPIYSAWDNFTGIPTATPSNGVTTSLSTADQIYNWVISLGYSIFGSSIDDTEMTNENFGEFTCTGLEDGCTLNSGVYDDEYIELADAFGGEVTGTYGAIVLDNDALDDQYYDSEADLTGLLDDNYVDVSGDTMNGNLAFGTNNITMEGGTIYSNSTCLKFSGSTTDWEIC